MWLVALCDHWRAFHKQEEVMHLILSWKNDCIVQHTLRLVWYFWDNSSSGIKIEGHRRPTSQMMHKNAEATLMSSILAHIHWVVPAVGRFPWRYQSEWIAFSSFLNLLLTTLFYWDIQSCSQEAVALLVWTEVCCNKADWVHALGPLLFFLFFGWLLA